MVFFSLRSEIPVKSQRINGDNLPLGKRRRANHLELQVRAIVDTLLALLFILLEHAIMVNLVYNLGSWKDSRYHALALLYIYWQLWVLISVYFKTLRNLVCALVHR